MTQSACLFQSLPGGAPGEQPGERSKTRIGRDRVRPLCLCRCFAVCGPHEQKIGERATK